MQRQLDRKRVLVIGGSSGIGKAVATAAASQGASVTIAGRSERRLHAAAKTIGKDVKSAQVDLTESESVRNPFKAVGTINHLAITGPAPEFGAFKDLDLATVKREFDGKFWG